MQSLVSIREASEWASKSFNRDITPSNISYLIQYGKIKKYGDNGTTRIDLIDLNDYYRSFLGNRELSWKEKLGKDLNWHLSFDYLREKDTTKHVHRLHPYKGKFIPQLVQYFLDDHTDNFKKEVYFKKGDVVLDPFVGSGTTLVQADELGIHSIGVDISRFNCIIGEVKLNNYNINSLENDIKKVQKAIINYETDRTINDFEKALLNRLNEFNNRYFPSPEFKYKIYKKQINEYDFSKDKERDFLRIYENLIRKYSIELKPFFGKTFLDKWYIKNVRKEIDFAFTQVKEIKDIKNKKLIAVILSRTIRSCRATTHSDLATLKEPQLTTYYCWKHKKICKPLFSLKSWFDRYSIDTMTRIREFSKLRTDSHSAVITADSRTVNLFIKI